MTEPATMSSRTRRTPFVFRLALTSTVFAATAGALMAASTSSTRVAAQEDAEAASTALVSDAPIRDALANLDDDTRLFNLHVTTLANPWFGGRLPGTQGMERAKQYVEEHFAQYGLTQPFDLVETDSDGNETVTERANWRQGFPLGGTMDVTEAAVTSLGGDTPMDFIAEEDFNVMGIGGSGSETAQVVFVGYGIDNGPDEWSDFDEDTDLDGQIAMLFRFEPMDEDGKSQWATGRQAWSRRAGFANKVRAVSERGASAVVIVNTPGADDPRAGVLSDPGSGGRGVGPMPIVMMTAEAADEFVRAADPEGRSIEEMRAFADEGGGLVQLDGIMSITTKLERTPVNAENVGGLLEGKGKLKDEIIVVGGHLDHLGMGYFGSRSGAGKLHPGADDNASGSAGVILFADKMAKSYAELPDDADARSVLFIAFTGEESGLNGSRHYVTDPIAPIEDHKLMINFDMIGRILNNRLSLSGVNTGDGLREIVESHAEDSPLDVVIPNGMNGASDHTSFNRRGVPVLFGIIADFHEDYHTPDDVEWKLNRLGGARTIQLFHDIAFDIATREEAPALSTGRGDEPAADPGPGRGAMKVRFGIQPAAYDEGGVGIGVASVTEGGSADLAGVQDGDVLVRWDGQKIATVQEWMVLLARHEPGDTVKIGVKRDGEEITLEVTLQAR